MKLLSAPLLLTALLLGSQAARAADWVPVAVAGSDDQYFYDRSKLLIKDDEISFWQKIVFHDPQPVNDGAAVSSLRLERMDCAEHSSRLVSRLFFTESGTLLERLDKSDSAAEPIIPDSAGDVFEAALCPQVWQKQEEARIKAEQTADPVAPPTIKAEAASQVEPAATPAEPAKPAPPPMPHEIEQLY